MSGYHLRGGGHHRWPGRCRFTVSHPDHPQHLYGLRINQRSAAAGTTKLGGPRRSLFRSKYPIPAD